MQPRRARDRRVREAVARGVRARAGRAVALGAAEAATGPSVGRTGRAAEPFASGHAAFRAPGALQAGLAGVLTTVTCSQTAAGEPHGLHGPPPQPTQPWIAPSETFVPVRNSPAPSDPTPRNLKNCRLDDFPASLRAAADVRSIYARLGIGASTGGQAHGWSPEWRRGVHGIAVFVKQWQAGSLQFPFGPQLHSEQRKRQPTRRSGGPLRQQNHSPRRDAARPGSRRPAGTSCR